MKLTRVGVLVIVAALLPGISQAKNGPWTVRGQLGYMASTMLGRSNLPKSDPDLGTVYRYAGGGFALGANVEYQPHRLVGIELGYYAAETQVHFTYSSSTIGSGGASNEFLLAPVSLALNFHPLRNPAVDFYVGWAVAVVLYTPTYLTFPIENMPASVFQTGNEFTFVGFNIGADIPFARSGWALNISLKYFDADADENHVLPLDPMFIAFGVAREF